MKVLLTGPDGILGTNLVHLLLERKYSVRAMVQEGKTAPLLESLPIEIVYGNLLDLAGLEDAVAGCDYVIHAAALTDTWPTQHPVYWKVNVEGTANMIAASRKAGIKRFIHVGTANSFGPGSAEKPGTEENPYSADRYRLDYISSKYRAHLLVLDEVKRGFDAVIVNPTFMIGPYDTKPSSGAMIIAVQSGKVPGYPRGGRNFVYVKDVAAAIVNAITMGRSGESYLLGHENLHYRDIFARMAAATGVKPPRMAMPNFLTVGYGWLMSQLGRLFRFTPGVNYRLAIISTEENFYSAEKAVAELNMPQTPIEVALDDAVSWFRENGYLPA